MPTKLLLALLCACVLVSCSDDGADDLSAPRKFFERHKIGGSPDFGVIKWNDPNDHVITVHGFADDMKACQTVADAMNADACKETDGQNCLNPFSCTPLNH